MSCLLPFRALRQSETTTHPVYGDGHAARVRSDELERAGDVELLLGRSVDGAARGDVSVLVDVHVHRLPRRHLVHDLGARGRHRRRRRDGFLGALVPLALGGVC